MTVTTSATQSPATTGLGSIWSESALVAGRALRHFVRNPMMLVATFGFPLLQLFVLLAAFRLLVRDSTGVDYVVRLAPLIILVTAFSAIGSSAIAFWVDIRSGVVNRLRVMPINTVSVLLGRMLADLVRIVIIAVLVTAIAYIPGFRFRQGVLPALGFFGLVILFGLMCTVVSVAIALVAPYPPVIMQWVQMPVLVLTLLSTGYMPLKAYPGFIQPVVAAQPVSTAVQALVSLSNGGSAPIEILGTIAWTVGISALCARVVIRRFRAFVG
jgi:ABC-2 type transport system permease protein